MVTNSWLICLRNWLLIGCSLKLFSSMIGYYDEAWWKVNLLFVSNSQIESDFLYRKVTTEIVLWPYSEPDHNLGNLDKYRVNPGFYWRTFRINPIRIHNAQNWLKTEVYIKTCRFMRNFSTQNRRQFQVKRSSRGDQGWSYKYTRLAFRLWLFTLSFTAQNKSLGNF